MFFSTPTPQEKFQSSVEDIKKQLNVHDFLQERELFVPESEHEVTTGTNRKGDDVWVVRFESEKHAQAFAQKAAAKLIRRLDNAIYWLVASGEALAGLSDHFEFAADKLLPPTPREESYYNSRTGTKYKFKVTLNQYHLLNMLYVPTKTQLYPLPYRLIDNFFHTIALLAKKTYFPDRDILFFIYLKYFGQSIIPEKQKREKLIQFVQDFKNNQYPFSALWRDNSGHIEKAIKFILNAISDVVIDDIGMRDLPLGIQKSSLASAGIDEKIPFAEKLDTAKKQEIIIALIKKPLEAFDMEIFQLDKNACTVLDPKLEIHHKYGRDSRLRFYHNLRDANSHEPQLLSHPTVDPEHLSKYVTDSTAPDHNFFFNTDKTSVYLNRECEELMKKRCMLSFLRDMAIRDENFVSSFLNFKLHMQELGLTQGYHGATVQELVDKIDEILKPFYPQPTPALKTAEPSARNYWVWATWPSTKDKKDQSKDEKMTPSKLDNPKRLQRLAVFIAAGQKYLPQNLFSLSPQREIIPPELKIDRDERLQQLSKLTTREAKEDYLVGEVEKKLYLLCVQYSESGTAKPNPVRREKIFFLNCILIKYYGIGCDPMSLFEAVKQVPPSDKALQGRRHEIRDLLEDIALTEAQLVAQETPLPSSASTSHLPHPKK